MKNAFRQSFEQEFKPFESAIENAAKEVKEEIYSAKAHLDHQEQMLQQLERDDASKDREKWRKLIPKMGNNLENIQKLQLQQSIYQSRKPHPLLPQR